MKITVTEDQSGLRLDKLLVTAMPSIGRAAAKRLFTAGRVRLLRVGSIRAKPVSKGDIAATGDVLEVDLDPTEVQGRAVPDPGAPLQVLLETPAIVIVEKPAGQPTAPLEPAERGTLANALVARYPELADIGFSPREPGLCHRLDTETSGLVLAARTEEAFNHVRQILKEGRLDKRYLLICSSENLPEVGSIEIPLAPHPKDRRRVYPCVHPRDIARYQPRPATTMYRKLNEHGGYALVEARVSKASRHQIRAHFAAIEHPLAGDALYGGQAIPGLSRHALHAHRIAWAGDSVLPAFCVTSALPADLAALMGTDG